MKFLRRALIRFYDDLADADYADVDRGSHVSAITGVIGEDLLLGLLFHYWESPPISLNARRLPDKCKAPGKKGKRLDAWVARGDERLFQIEIKNWSAHSLGERGLRIGASSNDIEEASHNRWVKFFGQNDKMPASALKILLNMPAPEQYASWPIERLLCFWLPLAESEVTPMTKTRILEKGISVFSASIYLRQLDVEELELEVPRIESRLKILSSLRPTQDPSPLRLARR